MKLGAKQIDLLKRIVATNGGGLTLPYGDKVLKSLFNKGLVQGKLGNGHIAVHTREGLEFIRAAKPKDPQDEK